MTEATMNRNRKPELDGVAPNPFATRDGAKAQPALARVPGGGPVMAGDGARNAACNFVLQQGLQVPETHSCRMLTSALLFQPRLVGLWGLVAASLQSGPGFAALAAVLLWSAFLPHRNPFDALYNRLVARRPQVPRLARAPAPRRFAQGAGGSFAAIIAACLILGRPQAGLVIEAVFFLEIVALLFGRFCLGSFLFHVSRGRVAFALRTLPWGRGGMYEMRSAGALRRSGPEVRAAGRDRS